MPRSFLIGCLFMFVTSAAVADDAVSERSRSAGASPRANTLVEIETTNGRTLVGHLEPDSDTRTVYLRSERPGIVLRTTVPASTIRQIGHYDGSHVLRLDGSVAATAAQRRSAAAVTSPSPPVQQASAVDGRVQTLRVDAWPENWDRDAELDGLRLLVTPVSAQGAPLAARGTLNVRLIVRRFSGVRNDDTVNVVEKWSRQLTSTDFGPEGAIVDLPFKQIDPERDLDVIPVGLLQAEFGVPGQGTYEAPAVEFWLRPASYLRDELQLHTGSREYQRQNLPRRIPGR